MIGIIKRIVGILLRVVLIFIGTSLLMKLVYKWAPVPYTPLMFIRLVDQKSDKQPTKLEHKWVSLDKISTKLQLAVLCSEDQNYLTHSGFDWVAIEKAMKENEQGKRLRGGSTISQQTAKNVFLWPGRSYIRKGLEVYFTLLIETLWSKHRILEVYLNSIEMGNGIYGAEAAAQNWFGKSASNLSASESAAIAAILPNPRKFSANPPGPYVVSRKAWIQQQMRFWGNKIDWGKADEEEVKKTDIKTTKGKGKSKNS